MLCVAQKRRNETPNILQYIFIQRVVTFEKFETQKPNVVMSARVRLDQIGLTDEEKMAVIVKLAEGSINTSNWNILDNVELAKSLRVLIQHGNVV